jgi:hypothetical protein
MKENMLKVRARAVLRYFAVFYFLKITGNSKIQVGKEEVAVFLKLIS